ncbi:MAG: YajQ family cyclic di-GMP-binding protein [Actinomycetales bacterium]|nr:YajQ family cyclic di-GMP-binding protein [Actinomycetales bacterium]
MADSSFDIVSRVDGQELDNAINQTQRELATRFDFKGTGAQIERSGELTVTLHAETEERVNAALDVFKDRLVRREISLKALRASEPRLSGKQYLIAATFTAGISGEHAKRITKLIRDEGPKGVRTQVTGEEVRVSSKSRDDLQATITLLREADLDLALQFVNYR